MNEVYRVFISRSPKEIWNVLEVTHNCTKLVNKLRKNTLTKKYRMFRTLWMKTFMVRRKDSLI